MRDNSVFPDYLALVDKEMQMVVRSSMQKLLLKQKFFN